MPATATTATTSTERPCRQRRARAIMANKQHGTRQKQVFRGQPGTGKRPPGPAPRREPGSPPQGRPGGRRQPRKLIGSSDS